jgi:hypothetical protein
MDFASDGKAKVSLLGGERIFFPRFKLFAFKKNGMKDFVGFDSKKIQLNSDSFFPL